MSEKIEKLHKQERNKQILFRQQKKAVVIVWTIVTLVTFSILLVLFIANKSTILRLSPDCISKMQFNRECSLCGMTRAFIEISKGNLRNAYFLNHGSVVLFLFFVFNLLLCALYWMFGKKTFLFH